MKAYIARYADSECCCLVHGETQGKAKYMFQISDPNWDGGDFTDIRLTRLPGCDDKPFTFENADAAGFNYRYEDSYPAYDDDGEIIKHPEWWNNDCRCNVCKRDENETTLFTAGLPCGTIPCKTATVEGGVR